MRTGYGYSPVLPICLHLPPIRKAVRISRMKPTILTKDARVADTFRHLQGVHPSITCLVDGDQAGRTYITALCALRYHDGPLSAGRMNGQWSA